MAQASAMFTPSILEERALVEPGAGAVGAGREGDARSTKARMCGCIASTSLDRNDFWILGIRPS
jgi:hypothetical protein